MQQMSQLEIYLLNDTHGYAETLATLADIAPNEILLHDGAKQRVLTDKITRRFANTADQKVVFISRQVCIIAHLVINTVHSRH
jgi:hypothetical protein